jgi:uncharacterized protein with HEPN domain
VRPSRHCPRISCARNHQSRGARSPECDQLAHRYFDTSHAVVAATVEHDLGDLYVATQRILDAMPDDD